MEENLWLSQKLIAELFQKDVRTINEHLQNIFDEGELAPEATIRKFRIVRREGSREVTRTVDHYNLDAILAVGYRVRSSRGTAFRQWATARLHDYLVKGFVLDDQRLKNPPGPGVPDYFDSKHAQRPFVSVTSQQGVIFDEPSRSTWRTIITSETIKGWGTP